MVEKLKSSLLSVSKGVITPLIAIFVFSLTIGLFLSLTLLVISIEEGAGSLSDSAMSMTWAVFMFAQGVGLTFGNCVVTIIPLGLTLLFIAVLVGLIRRIKGGSLAYITGLVVWVATHVVLAQNTHVTLVDSIVVIAGKTACVYILALLLAVFPNSEFWTVTKQRYKQVCSVRVQKIICVAKRAAVIVFASYALVAVATVVVWSCTHIGSVHSFFITLGMQNGSRILTTLACFIWLPNVAIWALSWICGAGFSIGKVAYFTLSAAQYKHLPPVPVFGIFPDAISDATYRAVCYGIIPVVCCVIMLIVILHKRGCGLGVININNKTERKAFIIAVVQAAIVSIGVAAFITVVGTIIFACANGSLGEYRLAVVGVDVVESTRAVGHLTLYAVIVSWVLALVISLLICGVRYCLSLLTHHRVSHSDGQQHKDSAKTASDDAIRTVETTAAATTAKNVTKDAVTSAIQDTTRTTGTSAIQEATKSVTKSNAEIATKTVTNTAVKDNTDNTKESNVTRKTTSHNQPLRSVHSTEVSASNSDNKKHDNISHENNNQPVTADQEDNSENHTERLNHTHKSRFTTESMATTESKPTTVKQPISAAVNKLHTQMSKTLGAVASASHSAVSAASSSVNQCAHAVKKLIALLPGMQPLQTHHSEARVSSSTVTRDNRTNQPRTVQSAELHRVTNLRKTTSSQSSHNQQSHTYQPAFTDRAARIATSNASSQVNMPTQNSEQQPPLSLKKAYPRTASSKTKRK